MKDKVTEERIRNLLYWAALALVIGLGLFLRLSDLEADPPLYFDGYGQSLTTDPYHYVFHARNKILFGEGDPLHQDMWRVFEYTLVSGASYLMFLLFGISRFNANLIGVILSVGAILIFSVTMRRWIGRWGMVLILFLLLFNKVLFVYGRLPYTENGLMFLAALLFMILVRYRQKWWGLAAVGILAALAGLSGKAFGFVLIVPVATALWYSRAENRKKEILTVAMAGGATVLLWFILIFGANFKSFADFLYMQAIGIHGFPDAFKSPAKFFERLISFGNNSLFYILAPALGGGGFFAILILLLNYPRRKILENFPVIFMVVWFAAGLLLFMPGNYRPIRYVYMLYLPLAGLTGYALLGAGNTKYAERKERSGVDYLTAGLLLFILWTFFEQAGFSFYGRPQILTDIEAVIRKYVWPALVPAIVLVLLEMKFHVLRWIVARRSVRFVVLIGVVLIAGWDFGRSYYDWQKQKSFNIREAAVDLGQILGPDAIISGPLTPTLLLENRLKGLIYAAGVSRDDPVLFRKNPVTHIAIESSASNLIVDEFPGLKGAQKVSEYWLRDAGIVLARVAALTGNQTAAGYRMTDYEIGHRYLDERKFDSAFDYMGRFLARFPENKSALRDMSELYGLRGLLDSGLTVIREDVALHPDDFSLMMALAIYYQKAYVATGDKRFRDRALQTYMRVIDKNPYQADEISTMSKKIASMKLPGQ